MTPVGLRWLAGGLLLALTACQQSETPSAPIRPAQVWEVNDQNTTSTLSYSGEIKARVEADLAFRVAGKLTQRHVDIGDKVTQGQLLASLDTTDLQLNRQAALASVQAARSEVDTAKGEWERNRALFEKNFISKAALDTYNNRLNAAKANLSAAQAQLDLAQNQAGYTELHADQAGVITAAMVETGQVVAAGQAVLHLAYEGEREVQIRLGENTAKNLSVGTLVSVSLWAQPAQVFQGKVREIAPAVDATRSFLVKISLLNPPENVALGVTADVRLPQTHTANAHWLPASALFQEAKQPAVWVVDANHQVKTQVVEVMAYQENGITVSGLSKGMQVIAAGVHQLSTGQTINPIPYDGKASP